MPRTSGETGSGSGQPAGALQWPKGTKWAYFKKLPPGITTGNGKGAGWVRVGSDNWHKIQSYNNGSHRHVSAGGGHGGHGTTSVPNTQYHPSRKATQQYNPSSPRGQIILNNGSTSSDGKKNPGVDPGRGGEQGAKHNGTAGDQTPGGDRNPGNAPKDKTNKTTKTTTQQEKQWSKFMGNPNTQSLIPLKDAAAQAGLQYDGQIKDARVAKADQIAQAGQNLQDIKTWYSHLINMNAGAATANDQAVGAETSGNNADLQAALAAIGGSANAGSASVADHGLQANRFARQMGQNADDYFGQQAVALGQNEDAQRLAQKALDSQTSQSLDSNLQNLIGQRGQALTTAQMAIIAANNAAKQGNFGNRISKAQSIAGLLQLGLNAKISAAQLRQMGGGGGAHPGFTKFSSQTPAQQQQTLTMLLQGGKDAQGNPIAIPLVQAAQRAKLAGYDAAPGSTLWKLLATYTH
jgi:hypothetical protein